MSGHGATLPAMSTFVKTAEPWEPAAHAEQVIDAATALATFVATSPGLDPRPGVRAEVLRLYVMMLVTQGTLPTKDATRYVSAGARSAPSGERFEHEHVYTRKQLTDLILANPNPEAIRWVLSNLAVAATVTATEHRALTGIPKTVHGWDRYVAAGIEVTDLKTGQPVAGGPSIPEWIIQPGDGREALTMPSDPLARVLASEDFKALLDPEVEMIEGFPDWPTRRAEAFEVIKTVSHGAGAGFSSREAARESLFAQQANGFGIRPWLQDLVLDMLRSDNR